MTNVALTGLARDLAKRASEGRPVRIGVIGSGEMGTDLVTQGMLMPGISIAAISYQKRICWRSNIPTRGECSADMLATAARACACRR